MSKNTVNQAELNKHHEIIFKIRERMNQMKIDTKNIPTTCEEKSRIKIQISLIREVKSFQ
jgi:hypothetical protein